MHIIQIRARNQMVCVASEISYGEIEILLPKGGCLYISLQREDMDHYAVSKTSVYDYLSDVSEKRPKLSEEYDTWTKAQSSKYAEYFKILRRILKDLDK